MAQPSLAFDLPPAVAELLQSICDRRSLDYPDSTALDALRNIGEAEALRALHAIDGSPSIRTLSGFIMYMARQTTIRRETGGASTCAAPCRAWVPVFPSDNLQIGSPGNLQNWGRDMDPMEVTSQLRAPQHPVFEQSGYIQDRQLHTPSPVKDMMHPVGQMTSASPRTIDNGPMEVTSQLRVPQQPVFEQSGYIQDRQLHTPSPVKDMTRRVGRITCTSPRTIDDGDCRINDGVEVANLLGNTSCGGMARRVLESALGSPDTMMASPRPLHGTSRMRTTLQFDARAPSLPGSDKLNTLQNGFCRGLGRLLHDGTSPQVLELGALEFKKAFLILSYIGHKRLEDMLTVDYIKFLKPLNMCKFENDLWTNVGQHCIPKLDRRKYHDWDDAKAHMYHCYVDIEGNTRFKGPFLESTRTLLQKVLGDENVLVVKFAASEESVSPGETQSVGLQRYCHYHQIAESGILVGLRRYRFFVFKDGGKSSNKSINGKKCPFASEVRSYFVRVESGWECDNDSYVLNNKTMYEARSFFMHIHTAQNLAKYVNRFSLILSRTMTLDVDFGTIDIEEIPDVPCKDESGNIIFDADGEETVHTDGTGYISEDLARKCHINIVHGADGSDSSRWRSAFRKKHKSSWEYPLLIQCRLFSNGMAVKGTLLVDRRLPQRRICIRPSMIKIRPDPSIFNGQSCNSLEIVSTSNKPKRGCLSKHLILLLHYGGVPLDFFLNLVSIALEEAQEARCTTTAALTVAERFSGMDDGFLTGRMIGSGIPLSEPFLKSRLALFMDETRKDLKSGKLPLDECYYLMGTADPTGCLKPNQVCVILQDGQLSGDVLVYKNPGLHFGDVHILQAVYLKDLEDVVGNAKYAIFFPVTGPRSIADEMANSDFDGDMYWVSRNPELLRLFKTSEPWVKKPTPPFKQKSLLECGDDIEKALFHEFLKTRFTPSPAVGLSAIFWEVYMDRLLTHDVGETEKQILVQKILKLVDIYYNALDAPKKGMKVDIPKELMVQMLPHYRGGDDNNYDLGGKQTYHSTSVLGQIYDKVVEYQTANTGPPEISLLACFDEGDVSEESKKRWQDYYAEYLQESRKVMEPPRQGYTYDAFKNYKEEAFAGIYQRYKELLYEAPEFEESKKDKGIIFDEALAIYHIVYAHARNCNDVKRCGFAWKVAGSALCMLYASNSQQDCIPMSRDVLREILGARGGLE